MAVKPVQTVLFLVVAAAAAVGADLVDQFDQSSLNIQPNDDLFTILKKASFVKRKYYGETEIQVNGFSWSNCGPGTDAIKVNSASVSPDPLNLPGNANVGFDVTFSAPIVAPLKAELKIEKRVLFWIEIPCISNVGSCTYNDICSMIPSPPGGQCPPPFSSYKIPCRCPFKPGRYRLPSYQVYINDSSIPAALADGDFRVTARLSTNGKQVACVAGTLSVTRHQTAASRKMK
ncbi:ganglioside GM2 activator-like [Tubulanus polymorphus]|uniref:ganglioside GM2 activator-like n=1 Tax=Tubulanus polymorphus TaxID=672921 RepID=UPI003DA36EE9